MNLRHKPNSNDPLTYTLRDSEDWLWELYTEQQVKVPSLLGLIYELRREIEDREGEMFKPARSRE